MVGDKPSTKRYTINPESDYPEKGAIQKSYYHDCYELPVNNLADLYDQILIARNTKNGYIIRGKPQQEYQSKIRCKLWLDENKTQPNLAESGSAWVCLDFDKAETPEELDRNSIEAIEFLIDNNLPKVFKNTSFIYQWSASAGLEYRGQEIKPGTNVHLFFYLDKLVTNTQFKFWFNKQISKENFDPSTFNTVLPIFVNSDVIKDIRIIDTIPDEAKYGIVLKDHDIVKVPTIKPILKKPMTATQSINVNSQNEILQELNSSGAIYLKGQGYYKLWHNGESSKGDWFVYTANLAVVHHHVKKSMRIDKWLKEFWGVESKVKFESSEIKFKNRNKL